MHKLIDPTLPTTKTSPAKNVLFQPWKYHENTYPEKKIFCCAWKKDKESPLLSLKKEKWKSYAFKTFRLKIARHPSHQQLWSRRMIIISQFLLRTKALCRRMREKSICFFLDRYSSSSWYLPSQLRQQEKLKLKKRKKRDVFERRFHKCSNLLNRENNCKLINQQTGALFSKCSLFFDLSALPSILFL